MEKPSLLAAMLAIALAVSASALARMGPASWFRGFISSAGTLVEGEPAHEPGSDRGPSP